MIGCRSVALSLALALVSMPGLAATTIKLATLVPEGSVWDQELRAMGESWQESTDGRVELRIYPGGVAGDEPDVVRKMRIGQLHAATLTVSGLSEIDDGFSVFEIPMFYESYEELEAVVETLEPVLTERLRAKGFELLNWGHAGWVHLFSKKAVRRPEDLKAQKLFVWAGDSRMAQWWKSNGYDPVPLAATDIMTGLQTGLIEAYPTTPLAALSLQWYRLTPYLLDLGLAPLVGATIVTERAWNRVDEGDRGRLRTAAESVEARLSEEIPRQDREAIEEMAKRGLEVVTLSPDGADEQAWAAAADAFGRTMRGLTVPAEVFDQALEARDRYRREQRP